MLSRASIPHPLFPRNADPTNSSSSQYHFFEGVLVPIASNTVHSESLGISIIWATHEGVVCMLAQCAVGATLLSNKAMVYTL